MPSCQDQGARAADRVSEEGVISSGVSRPYGQPAGRDSTPRFFVLHSADEKRSGTFDGCAGFGPCRTIPQRVPCCPAGCGLHLPEPGRLQARTRPDGMHQGGRRRLSGALRNGPQCHHMAQTSGWLSRSPVVRCAIAFDPVAAVQAFARCPRAAYMAMAAAFETFSDLIVPGISRRASALTVWRVF